MTDRQEIYETLAAILQADTGVPPEALAQGEEASLRDGLMLDSLDLVGVLMRVEETYHIRLAQSELGEVHTVGELISLIEAKCREPRPQILGASAR